MSTPTTAPLEDLDTLVHRTVEKFNALPPEMQADLRLVQRILMVHSEVQSDLNDVPRTNAPTIEQVARTLLTQTSGEDYAQKKLSDPAFRKMLGG